MCSYYGNIDVTFCDTAMLMISSKFSELKNLVSNAITIGRRYIRLQISHWRKYITSCAYNTHLNNLYFSVLHNNYRRIISTIYIISDNFIYQVLIIYINEFYSFYIRQNKY